MQHNLCTTDEHQLEQQPEEIAEPGYVALTFIPSHFLVGESIEARNGV